MMRTESEILLPAHLQQLDDEGYTVVRRFLDTSLTRRLREHIDSLCPTVGHAPGGLNTLRHPIPGAIMAEALYETPLLALATELLGATDLRLLEQVLVRTDPDPTKEQRGATGWHVDMAFLPEEYNAVPKRTYYHHIHALSTVEAGGGAFTIVPGSQHQTYRAAAKLGAEGLQQLKADPIALAGVDVSKAIEVCPEEGDLLIFNPMALHSASKNIQSTPRYVYFASFMDGSAEYLRGELKRTNYGHNLPATLQRGLPAGYPKLLSWDRTRRVHSY
jgi:ectoine hydroxylase-related dioxygenase (phytanoyl-CoA dioxygenase family)